MMLMLLLLASIDSIPVKLVDTFLKFSIKLLYGLTLFIPWYGRARHKFPRGFHKMTFLKKFKPILICIFFILSACSSSKSDEVPEVDNTKISTLSVEAANCEEKMRVHISKQSLPFVVVKQFEQDQTELPKYLEGTNESTLSILDRDSHFLEYSREDFYNRNNTKASRVSRIGLNEKGASNPLYFENGIKFINSNTVKTIIQRYILNTTDKTCIPELSYTKLSVIRKLSATSYQYQDTSISYNGEVMSDNLKNFSLKEHQRLTDFVFDSSSGTYEDALKLKDIFAFFPGIGVIEAILSPDTDYEELAFDRHFKFKMLKIRFLSQEKDFFSIVSGTDEPEKASITLQQNQKTWNLPFDKYFNKVFLGQAPISTSNASSKLDTDYQIKNNSMMLKTKNKIEFETFDAYWKTKKVESSADGYTYQLEENYLPTITSQTQDVDLVSNSTIQTNLPEIQEIAANIKKAANNERLKQIQMILDYLAKNYTYDYEMLNKGVIRPLTTKEALDRKKGVCQHYAVLFTTIARALNIPSRIIGGFLIQGENIGMHAWVEAELSPSLWQVIEPQSQQGLSDTRTRFYFPLSRSTNLEDKDSNFPDKFIKSFMTNKFEFLKSELQQ